MAGNVGIPARWGCRTKATVFIQSLFLSLLSPSMTQAQAVSSQPLEHGSAELSSISPGVTPKSQTRLPGQPSGGSKVEGIFFF